MTLKTYKPYTKSTRGTIILDRTGLWKGKPVKSLTAGINGSYGRNNLGRITSRHRSAGHKKKYRFVDFKRNKFDMPATVIRFEYDPYRTSNIMLVEYEDKTQSYLIAATVVHNVEMTPGNGGVLARSAGTSVQIMSHDQGYTTLKLASGEVRKVQSLCKATIGAVSNPDQKNIKIGKAGRSRWLGIRPQTRGIAMNPVDHPHGGRTNGGRHPVTPWGIKTKGKKTRKNKNTDKYIISRKKKRGIN
ncbi:MAG: 50S ribosomal protein L2 [Candidatus Fonsibacter ubiquis]|nr:50S ribosomal protein L2 [Candidatus Fonsibacter ubiquis]